MRQWSIALVFAGLVMSEACVHASTSVTTPQGKTAYTADQIVMRVGELQSAAIQANATQVSLANGTIRPALSDSTTWIIVQWCVNANMILKATPNGWQQTLTAAWDKAKTQIPAADLNNTAIAAAIAGVDVVLAALVGN